MYDLYVGIIIVCATDQLAMVNKGNCCLMAVTAVKSGWLIIMVTLINVCSSGVAVGPSGITTTPRNRDQLGRE